MKIAVLKFGGTSVAGAEARARALGHVRSYIERGYGVAVVVSAMGRLGAPYATDTLLSLLRGEETIPRTRDLMMSCGETISACVFADALCEAEIPALPMNGTSAGIQTNGEHLSSDITGMDTSHVMRALKAGRVAVITGFQGVSPDMETTTLGRGGSDTSAVTIGGYLAAAETVIYTDVPGVAEADPRIIPEARFIEEIDCDDMLLLASSGAGVIHPRAVEAGKRFNMDVFVRSTFDDGLGTAIRPMEKKPNGLIGLATKKNGDGTATVTVLLRPMNDSVANAARALLPGQSISCGSNGFRATLPESIANDAARALYRHFAAPAK